MLSSLELQQNTRVLGKLPAKSSPKSLLLSNYLKRGKRRATVAPVSYDFWKGRAPIPLYDTGNNEWGNCTRASQAIGAQRMERLEQRRTIVIPKSEIIRVYVDMSNRLYGGGDNGAYESDAMDEWRRPDLTFRDTKGRPHTIDAYVRVNHLDIEEMKEAFILAGAKGLKMCYNLPWNACLRAQRKEYIWDVPAGQSLTGEWKPGSWGGHSTWADAQWIKDWLEDYPSTWNDSNYRVSWRFVHAYCDEVYLAIDSVNAWKKKKEVASKIDLAGLVVDVNSVSSVKIGGKKAA